MENYLIQRDDKIGRYLVASRPLEKGTEIFSDLPFTLGPKPDSPPVCLGCHRTWNGAYKCSKCGWPCCGPKCEEMLIHRNQECEIFTENNVVFHNPPLYQPCLQFDCITPLRALLAKEKYPQRWLAEVSVMEAHTEERKLRPSWDVDQINIVDYLRGPCMLEERFSENLIQKVCGILEVNAVEVPFVYGPNLRAIFPKVAIMSHNCVPSIVHTIVSQKEAKSPDSVIARVWAARNLKRGEKLELCYTQVLQSTIERRQFLKKSKFFYCDCARCSDPLELGTEMSTLICSKCEAGHVRALNPLDMKSPWLCDRCNFETDSTNVKQLLKLINKEIAFTASEMGLKIENTEQLMKWLSNILHPNHAVFATLWYELLQSYGNIKGYELDRLSVESLKRKIALCEQLIKCLDVVSPGQTRIKGMTLFELQSAMLLVSKFEYKNNLITEDILKENLYKIKQSLKEAGEILSREDAESEKGALGREATKLYEELQMQAPWTTATT